MLAMPKAVLSESLFLPKSDNFREGTLFCPRRPSHAGMGQEKVSPTARILYHPKIPKYGVPGEWRTAHSYRCLHRHTKAEHVACVCRDAVTKVKSVQDSTMDYPKLATRCNAGYTGMSSHKTNRRNISAHAVI